MATKNISHKPQKGLPGKSYIYIMEIEHELKRFLSVVNESPYFNNYIFMYIVRHYRYKDREQTANNFIEFMCTYTPDRLYSLFPNKIFNRQMCIQLLNFVYRCVIKYKSIKKKLKNNQTVTNDEITFYMVFQKKWIVNEQFFIKQVIASYDAVYSIIQKLIDNYQSFIIKYLLKNRRGDKYPNHLKTDAYEIILTLINIYNYKRSKIPFHNILRPYIANHKNRLILDESWGGNDIVFLDSVTEKGYITDTNTKPSSEGEEVTSVAIKNSIWNEVERNYLLEKKQDDKLRLLELAYQSLPKPFQQVVSVLYEIVDPLSIEQETRLALSQKM